MNRTRENCKERMKMVLPVFNASFSQPNRQKKKGREEGTKVTKKRIESQRREENNKESGILWYD